MEQRISFVTLGVRDLAASRTFYVDGLGWVPELEVEGEVLMFRAGPLLVLSLWDRAHFAAEVGAGRHRRDPAHHARPQRRRGR